MGGSHEIYAGRRNQMKVEGPFDSLRGIELGLFVWSITKGGGNRYGRDPPASILLHSPGAGRSGAAGHSGALAWRHSRT